MSTPKLITPEMLAGLNDKLRETFEPWGDETTGIPLLATGTKETFNLAPKPTRVIVVAGRFLDNWAFREEPDGTTTLFVTPNLEVRARQLVEGGGTA